jgi:hypothetical protein
MADDRINRRPFGRAAGIAGRVAAIAVALTFPTAATAQDDTPARGAPPTSGRTAWFGLPLPATSAALAPVIVGTRGPRPVTLPAGEPAYPELQGAAIRKDLEAIVAIARESQHAREIGSGQLYGRISGFASGAKTAAWSADQFRGAGIADVKVQSIAQDPAASLWMPLSWTVTLLGDAAFGAGSADIVLESAMPLAPSAIPGGALTAPLVYVGNGSPAVLSHIDVKGKIAVQLVIPQAHMVFERDSVVPQAQALCKRGAVAVLNSSPGTPCSPPRRSS